MSLSKPKAPKESPDAARLRERQVLQLAELDREENTRIKRLMAGPKPLRVFRGSSGTRSAVSSKASTPTQNYGRMVGGYPGLIP